MVVSANTEFQVTEVSGTTQNPITRFFMNIGKIFAFHEGRLSDTAAFEVETPSGVAAIRGSSLGLSYEPGGTSRADGPRYGRRVGQDGTIVAVLICLEGSCTFKGPDGSLITLQGGQKVEVSADGTVSDILPVTDADLEGAFNAFGDAQNVGLIGGMNRDQFIFITPTPTTEPAQPPPAPVSTYTPTVDPSLSYKDFDVFNCTGIGNAQFTWISVRITYKDGQAINVIQTGGPFTGSWVPGCPPVDNAHQLCGDNICGPGEDTNNCPQDCAAYETCGNGICAGSETSGQLPAGLHTQEVHVRSSRNHEGAMRGRLLGQHQQYL